MSLPFGEDNPAISPKRMNCMKIAVLFPGQGSQYIGMSQAFIENDPECAALMALAEDVCELPLTALCVEGPMEELTRSVNLQPAITATNMVCWQALRSALPADAEVAYFAGHSLGEYAALYAAGVLGAEETLRLVAKRGALMDREGQLHPGGMRAVLGLDIGTIEQIVDAYVGEGCVTVANHNTPQQIVISGTVAALDAVDPALVEAGGKVIALNVSSGNHSPLVADAVPDFSAFMADIKFSTPVQPVLFNVSAAEEKDGEIMKGMMASQIASRVRWCEIIEKMLADGVDTFIEVGPKTVLKGMMRKIVPRGVKVLSLQVDSPETLQACLAKLEA
ncbi:related to malonyl CoA-acyl carrier protein transacylase [Desulfotalea psychrophila LSv54]|uniref:Malonyl CoA-acyl carrier protein transacylase n=2 Tax=Desulfotalea psychrophila TaxID=84980 RepID=Q6AK47_DESPS|nr:related to malonyl CoA-acyl carrier protein transacylase [Desulfotalea psychrophila LSv54]